MFYNSPVKLKTLVVIECNKRQLRMVDWRNIHTELLPLHS